MYSLEPGPSGVHLLLSMAPWLRQTGAGGVTHAILAMVSWSQTRQGKRLSTWSFANRKSVTGVGKSPVAYLSFCAKVGTGFWEVAVWQNGSNASGSGGPLFCGGFGTNEKKSKGKMQTGHGQNQARIMPYKNKIKRKLFFMNKFAFDRFSHTIPVVSLNLGDGSRQHSPCVMFRGGGGAGAAATKRKHQEKILLQGLKELLQNIGTADEPPVRGRSPVRESTPERAPSLSRSRSPSPAWQVKGKGKRKGKKGKENGEAHVHFEEAETQTHDTLLARLKAIVLAAETNKARNLLTDLQTSVQSYTPTEAPLWSTTLVSQRHSASKVSFRQTWSDA